MTNDGRRYRKVFVRLWRNPDFRRLPDGEKVLTLYLLSGPQTNRVGIFSLSLGATAEDLETTPALIKKRLERVCSAFGWQFDRDFSVLFIPSWWTFNTPKGNPQNFQGALTDLHDVPPSPLVNSFCTNTEGVPEDFRGFLQQWALPERCPSIAATQERRQEKQERRQDNSAPRAAFSPDALLARWNETAQAAGLRPCLALEGDRLTHARNRLKEHPDGAYWERVIQRIAASRFCQGNNERGWVADMDFLLRKSSHLKVLEGKYDDKSAKPTVGSPDYYTAKDWRKECAEMGHSPACPSPEWHQVQCDKAKGAAQC